MRKRLELSGLKFSKLLALKLVSNTGRSRWECLCDCGTTTYVEASNLTSGKVKSCGCHRSEAAAIRSTKHGKSSSKVYNAWNNIKARTTNVLCKEYKWYGARGILMHKDWVDSFEEFYAHVGDPEFLPASIDRMDNNKGYEPGNVRWASNETQANNRRNNHMIEIEGESKTAKQWSMLTGIKSSTILARIKAGWSSHDALTRPVERH